ncbi:hypothetical protein IJE86_03325 [bacterium]|nr:hypothetical protein [bacterium]
MTGINLNNFSVQNNGSIANTSRNNLFFNVRSNNFLPVQHDNFSFFSKPKEEPVTFKEGAKLVATGFWEKTKDCFKAILDNPLKTAAVIGGTTLGIMALPLIGISSVVGASALAIGFGGLALYNTAKHVKNAIVHSKNNEHNKLRDDLKKLGGDGLDLALTLPFLPKAVSCVKQHIKYAPKVALNKELFSNIKNAKGLNAKYIELLKGETRINYELITNEMGLKVKPKLVFDKMPTGLFAEYEPISGVIKVNEQSLNPLTRKSIQTLNNILDKKSPIKNFSIDGFLRHELEHFKQFSDISRLPGGVDKLKGLSLQYAKDAIPAVKAEIQKLEAQLDLGLSPVARKSVESSLEFYSKFLERMESMVNGSGKNFNTKFYQDIVKNNGIIKEGSKEAAAAEKYIQGFLDKTQQGPRVEEIMNNPKLSNVEKTLAVQRLYESNLLETPAFAVQKDYINKYVNWRPTTTNVVVQAQSATV